MHTLIHFLIHGLPHMVFCISIASNMTTCLSSMHTIQEQLTPHMRDAKEISCSEGRGLAHSCLTHAFFGSTRVQSLAGQREGGDGSTCSVAALELVDGVAPGVQLHAPPAQRQRGEALQLALNADMARCALLPQLAARQQQLQTLPSPLPAGTQPPCLHA